MQCVSLSTPKKAAQHTALLACDGVRQCVMLYGVWWVSVSMCCVVLWWCGGCREKKGRGKDTVKQKQKRTFPKTTFSLSHFFLLFFFHSFLLAFHSSTITPFLSKHSPVFYTSHECILDEPKTPMTQHLIHSIVFSFLSKPSFSLLFLQLMIQC